MAKDYANTKAHMIAAVLGGHYVFATKEQAKLQLKIISENYVVSRHASHRGGDESIVLWIKQYELTDEDKRSGLTGHFAQVRITKDKQWGFTVEKMEGDAPHPQKRRETMQHPNWGHPVLRAVEKKQGYASIEKILGEFALLQQEYPHVCVPGEHCLFVAVYGRADDKKGTRVKRYVLEIEPQQEGGFIIVAKEKKQKAPAAKKPKAEEKPPAEPVGFFTSKVALKRKKKKP